jgi:two-component system chemotaxis sensor kinase CheA
VIGGLILPLIGLPDELPAADKLRLLRLSDGSCELLHAVQKVEDAVELSGALTQVPEDPLIEAMTLVGGDPVALIDAHALFARHGEPPRAAPGTRPRCALPESDWARTILAPLVAAAGYDVVDPDSSDPDVVTIWLEETWEAAEALGRVPPGPVIRLSDHPGTGERGKAGDGAIYRYDREALLAALAAARTPRIAGERP